MIDARLKKIQNRIDKVKAKMNKLDSEINFVYAERYVSESWKRNKHSRLQSKRAKLSTQHRNLINRRNWFGRNLLVDEGDPTEDAASREIEAAIKNAMELEEQGNRDYNVVNYHYTLIRSKYSIPLMLSIIPLLMALFTFFQYSDDTWEIWFIVFLALASASASLGTATTTYQWAYPIKQKNPYRRATHKTFIIWLNRFVLGLSILYFLYLNKPEWFDQITLSFFSSLRVCMIIALVVEIVMDGVSTVYVSRKSAFNDAQFIRLFWGTELVVIGLSNLPTLPNWVLFVIGSVFAISHLISAKLCQLDSENNGEYESSLQQLNDTGLF